METIYSILIPVGAGFFLYMCWFLIKEFNGPNARKGMNVPMAPVQPVKVRSGYQVRFAGEWHECSPPLGENSPGWVNVRLTDRRTHSRIITRRPDEIRQV